jgi:hypothetical protein
MNELSPSLFSVDAEEWTMAERSMQLVKVFLRNIKVDADHPCNYQ